MLPVFSRMWVVVVFVISMWSGPTAFAQTVFTIEGPITAIDPAKRTITVGNDFAVEIPVSMRFTGPKGTGPASALKPSITGANAFTELLDTNAPNRVRSIFPSSRANPPTVMEYSGATLLAMGTTITDANGTHHIAAFADLKLAENVLVGKLVSVDPVAGTIVVDGTIVKMSPDDRFISEIVDPGLNQIPIIELASKGIGDIVTVTGYMVDSGYYGVRVMTTALIGSAGVTISQADGFASKMQMKIQGETAKLLPGQTVTVFDAVTNRQIGQFPVTVGGVPGQGRYQATLTVSAMPTSLRAVTSDGLTTTAIVRILK